MSLQSVKERYGALAQKARQLAQSEIPDPQVRILGISMREAVIGKGWNTGNPANEYGIEWDWVSFWDHYRRTNPRMLDVSLYYSSLVAGLALASPNKNKTYIGLDFIQAAPRNNPLKGKVFPCIVLAMRRYAGLLDASVLRVLNPLPSVVDYYGSQGFVHVNQPLGTRARSYMEMGV